MTISELQRMRQALPASNDRGAGLPTPRYDDGKDGFGSTLKDAIDRVDASQKAADQQIEAFVAGEQDSVHEVMIAMNQAEMHFQLMNEVRNKALDTYQQLMRMQV